MRLQALCTELQQTLETLQGHSLIEAINTLREILHRASPFRAEPVDHVSWVEAKCLRANDYNPNVMAPAERHLLQTSLRGDGYTQPIVVFDDGAGHYQVVDGFHRYELGRSDSLLRERLQGYLPVTRLDGVVPREAQMASTVRHNRARGQHQVQAMADIVRELSRRGWSDQRIARELGMDADEVLRLKQISGLADLFREEEFSEAWTVR